MAGLQLGQARLILDLGRRRIGKLLLRLLMLERVNIALDVLLVRILLQLELGNNAGVLVRRQRMLLLRVVVVLLWLQLEFLARIG